MLKRLLLGKNFGWKAEPSCADDTTVDVTSGLFGGLFSGVAENIKTNVRLELGGLGKRVVDFTLLCRIYPRHSDRQV